MTERTHLLAIVAVSVALLSSCTNSSPDQQPTDPAAPAPEAATSVAPSPTADAEIAPGPTDPGAAVDPVQWFLAALSASGWENLGADGQSMPLFWIVGHPATEREVEVTVFDVGNPANPPIDTPTDASVNGVAYVTGTTDGLPVARWSCRGAVFTLSVNGDDPVIAEELVTHC